MFLTTFISSLINIGANWGLGLFYSLLLRIDGWIYQLVSYAFNVFLLMCQVNYNSIYGIAAPLINRLQAVILVLIVFKIGVSLINYLLNPDSAMKDGSKLITNIFITAALLISQSFIFGLLNDFTLLMVGNQTGYPYTTLSTIVDLPDQNDKGLILRAMFGSGSDEIEDIGDYLAFETLAIFIHNYDDPTNSSVLEKTICDSDGTCDFNKLHNLGEKVDLTVEYHGGICFIIGLYIIYSIAKAAIEVGIRMFKLLILQIIAPVAIISIIKDGTKAGTFQSYIKKLGSVFVEAFARMFTMLLTVVFVCKFFVNIGDFFGNLTTAEGKFTKGLIIIIVIVAAFKIAGDIPKFIDEALGTKLSGDKKDGFGHFVGGVLGAGLGATVGAIGGAAGGGFGGALAGAGQGFINGAKSGSKGNNVAEFFKGQKDIRKNALQGGQNIAARGGLGNVMLGGIQSATGIGNRQDKRLAALDRQSAALDAYETAQKNAVKDLKMDKNDPLSSYYTDGFSEVKLGEDGDAYAREMIKYDTDVMGKQAALDVAMKSNDEDKIKEARIDLQNATYAATKRAKDYYDRRKEEASAGSAEAQAKKRDYEALGGNLSKGVKEEKKRLYNEKTSITNKESYARTHGGNPKK